MTMRRAACSCGQLHLAIGGESVRVSVCNCLECQRRTGAVISNQARFLREQVTLGGQAKTWKRIAESGNELTFYFCPTCGSTVYWENEGACRIHPGGCRQLRRSELPRTDRGGVGTVTTPVDPLAGRWTSDKCAETRVSGTPRFHFRSFASIRVSPRMSGFQDPACLFSSDSQKII